MIMARVASAEAQLEVAKARVEAIQEAINKLEGYGPITEEGDAKKMEKLEGLQKALREAKADLHQARVQAELEHIEKIIRPPVARPFVSVAHQ